MICCTRFIFKSNDDCLLYCVVSCEEDIAELQCDLNTIFKWSQLWQMKFKMCNLEVLQDLEPMLTDYFKNYKVLNSIHIWVWYLTKQCLLSHIQIVWHLMQPTLLNVIAPSKHASLVRPSLEYASSVWDAHHNNHIASTEKIQRRAVRWIFNDYNYSHSVTTMLQNLNWPTLQYRHKRMCLTLLYKSISGLLALKIPSYFTPTYTITRIHLITLHILERMPTWAVFFREQLLRNGMIYVNKPTHWIYLRKNWTLF